MEKKKVTNNVEERQVVQSETKVNERKDFFRRISENIPDHQLKTVLWVFGVFVLLGLSLNFYNTFWGSPKIRAQLKEKDRQIELLRQELVNRSGTNDVQELPLDISLPSGALLDTFDASTPDSVIFDAYGEGVDPLIVDGIE